MLVCVCGGGDGLRVCLVWFCTSLDVGVVVVVAMLSGCQFPLCYVCKLNFRY